MARTFRQAVSEPEAMADRDIHLSLPQDRDDGDWVVPCVPGWFPGVVAGQKALSVGTVLITSRAS